jgi:PST family polysaccharide transporter
MLDVIALAATVIGSICLAWLGHGYWSLVLPQLVIGPLTLVALVRMNGWMPGRWDRQTEVRSFMRLGMAYLMGGLLGYASKSLDLMVLGRQFGTEATGVYNRGTQLIRMPFTQLQTPFGSVLLPVLSRAADRGTNSLLNAVLHAQRAFAYPIAFGAGIVIAIPGEIIRVTLGSQWGGASWIVRATMLSVLLQAVAYPALWVFSAQGLARVIVSFNLLSAGISIAAIIVGSHWGPNGVATGTLISAALGAVVCLWFLRYRSGIPVGGLAFCGARILGLAGLATLAGIGASSLVGYSDGTAAVLSRIGIAILAAVITWSTAQLVPVVRSDFRAVLSLLLELRRR